MIQGTGSNVGKSLICTALCRLFSRDGYAVAPFKAQNLALNSFSTPDGGEIGRAQAVQAEAAGCQPSVEMNPILLKPDARAGCQVVLMGRAVGLESRGAPQDLWRRAWDAVEAAYRRLAASHDLIVIEGAGSPVEINLKVRDLANMRVAAMAAAPVVLVGDIDRGGVFASLVGTLALLDREDRDRVKGCILNKFRGDPELLAPGLRELERRIGRPVLGVVPYLEDLLFPAEDSLASGGWGGPGVGEQADIQIGVLALPHLSNDTDFDMLACEPGVSVRLLERPGQMAGIDLLILPGSKNTIDDLQHLRSRGFESAIRRHRDSGGAVFGICGGYQMLGHRIEDPYGVEGEVREAKGFGLLDVSTVLTTEKRVAQVRAVPSEAAGWSVGSPLEGYEVHLGVTRLGAGACPLFRILERDGRCGQRWDGAISGDRLVRGTYLHGLFDHPELRRRLVEDLRLRKGLPPGQAPLGPTGAACRAAVYDRLEETVRRSLDVRALYAIAGLERR